MFYFSVVGFLCVLSFSQPSSCSQINVPRVLLPVFKTTSVSFTFQITGGGCFQWSTSRSDVIAIKELDVDPYFHCSTKAVVTSTTMNFDRSTAIVLAEDIETGNIIRADVIVDVISSLKIATTTRVLYIDEPPELFEVRAYDIQGNEFSSLEGVEFQWKLNEFSLETVLQFMAFEGSPYGSPLSVQHFDSIEKRGHMVLLEGVKTGSAWVSVSLSHPEYSHVDSVEVSLTVVANLIIEPRDAHIILHDTVEYRLLQVQKEQRTELNLVESQYSLQSGDTSVAVVEKCDKSDHHVCITGISPGRTKLILHDSNVAHEVIEKLRFTYVTVGLPAYIGLSIWPHDTWAVVLKQPATIVSQVFDSDNHKFHLGSVLYVTTDIPHDLFEVTDKPSNGTVLSGFGLKTGVGPVFSTMKFEDIDHVVKSIETSKTLHVLEPISISPILVLSYERRNIQMTAEGGDGKYIWSSSNNSVASINHFGLLDVTNPGVTFITVTSKLSHYIQASSEVHVLIPYAIRILSHVYEGPVGYPIYLPLAMDGTAQVNGSLVKVPVTDCKSLKYNIHTNDNKFFIKESLDADSFSSACTTIAVIGKAEGESKVVISYNSEDTVLKSECLIVTFMKLTPVHPVNRKAVLAIGSSLQVAFVGGPQSRYSSISTTVTFEPFILSSHTILERKGFYVFEVKCIKIGKTIFSVLINSDRFILQNKWQHTSSYIIVICSEPFHVVLKGPTCPESGYKHVLAGKRQTVLLDVVIIDKSGLIFDNATSLFFKWRTSPNIGLLAYDTQGSVSLKTEKTPEYTRPVGHFKKFTTKSASGLVTINVKITAKKLSSFLGFADFVKASLVVKIVSNVVVEPKTITLLSHPTNKAQFKISSGSGHFDYIMDPKDFVDIEYADDKMLVLTPRYDGKGTLLVSDLCVVYPPVSVSVNVIQIGEIQITVVDKIEKGQEVIATIQIFGNNYKPIPLTDLIDEPSKLLVYCASPEIAEITKGKSTVEDKLNGIVHYYIRGLMAGTTTVLAKWLGAKSLPMSIQVFSPVRIFPRDLTLIVEAEIQVSVYGGPLPDPGLQFKIGDPHIATVTSSLVKGLHVGHTTLTVVARSHQSEICSKDSIEVHVILLNGIKIHAPIRELCVGCTMPLWAIGTPQTLSPLILGSVYPPYQFQWSVSSNNIALLKDTLQDTGIEILDEDRISVRIQGLKPGRVTVFLSMSGRSVERTFTFSSSIEVDIVKKLAVINHGRNDKTMLVAPNTNIQLKTNKDKDCSVHYQVFNFDMPQAFSDQLEENTENLGSQPGLAVSVDPSGHLSTGSVLGSALVIAQCVDEFLSQKELFGIVVEVKPVSYMIINIMSRIETDGRMLQSFPKGLTLLANITYHDSIGSVFDAVPSYIKFETSRVDCVQISQENSSNNIVNLSLKNNGSAVVHFYDQELHETGDYVKFSIKNQLHPSRVHLSVGEIVCFKVPIVNCDSVWNSVNDSVAINNHGVAYAAKIGSSLISFSCKKPTSLISAFTGVTVHPLNSVQFENTGNFGITNSNAGTKFPVPFTLRNEKNKYDILLSFINTCPERIIPEKFPFHCEISFSNDDTPAIESLFAVGPSFNADLGLYTCEITSFGGVTYNNSLIESSITLKTIVEDSIFDSFTFPFYPAIFISSQVLHFSSVNSPTMLKVTGINEVLTQIYIEVSDVKVLTVKEPDRSKKVSITYPVILEKEYWRHPNNYKDLSLMVISNITNQKLKVEIGTILSRLDNSVIPYVILKSDTWWQHYAVILNIYKKPIIVVFGFISLYLMYKYFLLECRRNYSKIKNYVKDNNEAPERTFFVTDVTDNTSFLLTPSPEIRSVNHTDRPLRYRVVQRTSQNLN